MSNIYSSGPMGGFSYDSMADGDYSQSSERRLDDISTTLILPSPGASNVNVENDPNIAGSLDTILNTCNCDASTSFEENKTEEKTIETTTGNETALIHEFLKNWTPVLSVAPANLQLRAPAPTTQLIGPVPSPIVNVVLPTQSNLPTLAAAVNNAATGTVQGFASTPNVSQTTNPPTVASYGPLEKNPYYRLLDPSVQRAMVASTPTTMLPFYTQINVTSQPTLTQVGVPLTSPSTFPAALASVAWTSNTADATSFVTPSPLSTHTYTSAVPTQPIPEFACRWLVPGGICGAKETDREDMVDHIKEKHEFLRTVDKENPAITRRGCCWEGCGVVLSPSTNLKAHLRTHLKLKDHIPLNYEDHYQGRASCKGKRWSPYQKGH